MLLDMGNHKVRCFHHFRSRQWRCFIKKCVLNNFAKFTRKHLCQGPFLIKLQATYFMEHLWMTTSVVLYVRLTGQYFFFLYKTYFKPKIHETITSN